MVSVPSIFIVLRFVSSWDLLNNVSSIKFVMV